MKKKSKSKLFNFQDVLLGGTTKLEWLFRFSLINDMVNGISYLHGTVLTFHGRLSSACCYVNGLSDICSLHLVALYYDSVIICGLYM